MLSLRWFFLGILYVTYIIRNYLLIYKSDIPSVATFYITFYLTLSLLTR